MKSHDGSHQISSYELHRTPVDGPLSHSGPSNLCPGNAGYPCYYYIYLNKFNLGTWRMTAMGSYMWWHYNGLDLFWPAMHGAHRLGLTAASASTLTIRLSISSFLLFSCTYLSICLFIRWSTYLFIHSLIHIDLPASLLVSAQIDLRPSQSLSALDVTRIRRGLGKALIMFRYHLHFSKDVGLSPHHNDFLL